MTYRGNGVVCVTDDILLNIVEINLPRSSSVPRLCHIQHGDTIFISYHARTETAAFTVILKLIYYARMGQVPSLFPYLEEFLSGFYVSITLVVGVHTNTSILMFYTQVSEADPAMLDRGGHNLPPLTKF